MTNGENLNSQFLNWAGKVANTENSDPVGNFQLGVLLFLLKGYYWQNVDVNPKEIYHKQEKSIKNPCPPPFEDNFSAVLMYKDELGDETRAKLERLWHVHLPQPGPQSNTELVVSVSIDKDLARHGSIKEQLQDEHAVTDGNGKIKATFVAVPERTLYPFRLEAFRKIFMANAYVWAVPKLPGFDVSLWDDPRVQRVVDPSSVSPAQASQIAKARVAEWRFKIYYWDLVPDFLYVGSKITWEAITQVAQPNYSNSVVDVIIQFLNKDKHKDISEPKIIDGKDPIPGVDEPVSSISQNQGFINTFENSLAVTEDSSVQTENKKKYVGRSKSVDYQTFEYKPKSEDIVVLRKELYPGTLESEISVDPATDELVVALSNPEGTYEYIVQQDPPNDKGELPPPTSFQSMQWMAGFWKLIHEIEPKSIRRGLCKYEFRGWQGDVYREVASESDKKFHAVLDPKTLKLQFLKKIAGSHSDGFFSLHGSVHGRDKIEGEIELQLIVSTPTESDGETE
jgi:hypothetical protein